MVSHPCRRGGELFRVFTVYRAAGQAGRGSRVALKMRQGPTLGDFNNFGRAMPSGALR